MTGNRRPAEPVVDDDGNKLGGYSLVAAYINERFPAQDRRQPVSRQLVHKWYRYRTHNRFPHAVDYTPTHGTTGGNPLFRIDDVLAWYADRRQYRIGKDTAAQNTPNSTTSGTLAA